MAGLAARFQGLCALEKLEKASAGDRVDIHCLKLANPGEPDRPVVMIIGGVHGREYPPPDALIRFARALLTSFTDKSDTVFPAMTCRLLGRPPLSLPAFRIPYPTVAKILNRCDVYIVPLVNPDGRLHNMRHPPSDPVNEGWRKNRRPDPGGVEAKVGVDIARNFDIAWKFEDYFNLPLYLQRHEKPPADTVATGTRYRGPSAGSEPETDNVQRLIDAKRPRWFCDVHTFGRDIATSWGLEWNGATPAMTWRNPVYTGKRDGLPPGDPHLGALTDYQEYVPDEPPHRVRTNLREYAESMRNAILRSAGVDLDNHTYSPQRENSTYSTGQLAALYLADKGGPITGGSVDYAFKAQFEDPARAPVFAFVMEAGHADERAFDPSYSAADGHWAKIEREICAAMTRMCLLAANHGRLCLVATTVMDTPDHPAVAALRRLRDQRLGRRFDRLYGRVSPPIARYLAVRPWARFLVRHCVVAPAALLARLLTRNQDHLQTRDEDHLSAKTDDHLAARDEDCLPTRDGERVSTEDEGRGDGGDG